MNNFLLQIYLNQIMIYLDDFIFLNFDDFPLLLKAYKALYEFVNQIFLRYLFHTTQS